MLVALPRLPENIAQATRAACRNRTSPDMNFVRRDDQMLSRRRDFLAGTAGMAAMAGIPAVAWPQAKPRVTVISQWAAGSDGAAITGARQAVRGGRRHLAAQPGARLHHRHDEQAARADHLRRSAGRLAAQGPGDRRLVEDRADRRSRRGGGRRRLREVVPADLVELHKPYGHWIALPMQVYRINTIFIRRRRWTRSARPGADDLGRVQRARHGDESRRHHSGRQWRHPMG